MQIRLENVSKTYGSVKAVKDFSATLPDANLICLLGPSGCGKSTLLNMLCGITPVTEGHIYFDDRDVTKEPPDKRDIGMVFQNYALYPHLSVCDNICFPLEVQKIPRKQRIEKALDVAKLVHVDSLMHRYPGELSGGQQQRVAIARALVKNPELLLMDEPLSNLDARLRLEMREEIRRIQQETKVTTIFVTHDQEEAMSISDSIILMREGSLVQGGLCQELYDDPICSFAAEFLGNPPINKIEHLESLGEDEILYVRPEAFVLGGNMEALVERVSLMGKDEIVYLRLGDTVVRAIFSSEREFERGERVTFSFKKKGVFRFNAETGMRVR